MTRGRLTDNAHEANGYPLFATRSGDTEAAYVLPSLTESCLGNPDKDLSSLSPVSHLAVDCAANTKEKEISYV